MCRFSLIQVSYPKIDFFMKKKLPGEKRLPGDLNKSSCRQKSTFGQLWMSSTKRWTLMKNELMWLLRKR